MATRNGINGNHFNNPCSVIKLYLEFYSSYHRRKFYYFVDTIFTGVRVRYVATVFSLAIGATTATTKI